MRRVIDYDRCSDPSQIKGTTFDRQESAFDKFIASGNGEYTPHHLKFRDAGKSAFRGNKQKQLDECVKLIEEAKEIVAGDIIFFEHTDRLSRKGIMPTFEQVIFLFKHGIDIAIASPYQKLYRACDKNDVGLVFELAGLAYANWLYSKGLSDKVSGFWVFARKKMREKGWKFAANCPAWLHWNKETKSYDTDPVAVAGILYMLERTLQGQGAPTIVRELHERFSAFGRKPKDGKPPSRWNKAYVRQILRGREILGEYQPGKNKITVDAAGNETVQYVFDGEPIPNYYPSITDEATWQAVQESIENRKREKGPSKDFINLFSASAAVVGSSAAIIGIIIACTQLYNLNKTMRMNSLGIVLTLECEMSARKKACDDLSATIRIECGKESPNKGLVIILDDQLKGYKESWFNACERLAYCILKGFLSERDWRAEYREYFFTLVRVHKENFGTDSIYTNVIDLTDKWKRE